MVLSRHGGVAECGLDFSCQGKYAVEIVKKFGMLDSKAITITMESNLKLLSDASSKKVNDTMYH